MITIKITIQEMETGTVETRINACDIGTTKEAVMAKVALEGLKFAIRYMGEQHGEIITASEKSSIKPIGPQQGNN